MPAARADHAGRREALARVLSPDLGGLLVTSVENVRYLTGFAGSHGAILLDRTGDSWLATDGRYLERAAAEAPDVECLEARRAAVTLVGKARELGIARLGYDGASTTVEALDALMKEAAGQVELVRAPHLVEQLRSVKDPAELAVIERACAITAQAFEAVAGGLVTGMTERDVAWQLTVAMRERGADADAFDSIVAFGPHSAIPHHEPTDRPLQRGDLVKLDFGARVDGYCSDMTRTVVLGPGAAWQRELHEQVRQLQSGLSDAAVSGAVPSDLDAAMRASLLGEGHHPLHGLGHGVGLAIHEDPFLTENSPAPALRAGCVVTIEPGIYLSGRGGVRIEDTVVVTESGAPRVLTTAPRDLLEV